ncbi:MAG: guanylate kinase [Actinomycetota bacterium]|nr:guanylate kinase [Actinomycetota bacterium]
MPNQPIEDGGRPLRTAAGGARRTPAPLTGDPKLFVVTGPSGAGKGTLIQRLAARRADLEVAVSATTRPRRAGEVDGRDYYFMSEAEFLERVERGEFLEHVVYVSGHRYGTLLAEIDRILGEGRSCVLELETEGARRVKDARPESVTLFVDAPSFAELERRLRARATESAGEIEERLELSRRQREDADEFDYTVVNDDVEGAVSRLAAVIVRGRAECPAPASGEPV